MLTVMVVDDDPLLCTAMRRKIEMIDRENQLGIQETLMPTRPKRRGGFCRKSPLIY